MNNDGKVRHVRFAVEVQTRYSFTRKVAERDEYIPHIIDLGDTLFTKGGAS